MRTLIASMPRRRARSERAFSLDLLCTHERKKRLCAISSHAESHLMMMVMMMMIT